MPKHIKIIFYSLILIFLLTILTIFTELIELSSYLFPTLFILCFLLGLTLLFLSIKLEKSKIKTLLIINSSALIGIPLLSVLHNLFYALGEKVSITLLNNLLPIFNATFFIISVIVCPIVFIVSCIWILDLDFKRDR
jgi:uncharacterized membrane protein YhdT